MANEDVEDEAGHRFGRAGPLALGVAVGALADEAGGDEGDAAEEVALYEEPLARWTQADPAAQQARGIDQLQGALGEARHSGSEIPTWAEELREGTTDHLRRMDEVALALEVLSGKRKPPGW